MTLSFNKVGQRIVVPFAALTSYADPSVKFGLQFGASPEADGEMSTSEASDKPAKRKARGKKAEPEDRATGSVPAAGGEKAPPEAAEDDTEAQDANGEKVVTLDRFRKK